MKDIRPVLKQLQEVLNSEDKPFDISQKAAEIVRESSLGGTVLGERLSFMDCWDEGAYCSCECEACLESFEQTRKESLECIKQLQTDQWPDSADALVATYHKPTAGLSLKVIIQVSSFSVECSEEKLRVEVEEVLAKLNQDQSAENFLLNAVYVLPKEYKDYKLTL